ncbi:hypothetical protein [Burkholderia sp. LMU1-1-1.1]|uniref:hypothetical protein n=1 Tax=Burkholderia sp. LMU1-1-1.1 TaxID=3135266 RepID=UPI0034414F2A
MPAPPAAPAAPAAPISFGNSTVNLGDKHADRAYAIVWNGTDHVHISGSSDDVRRIAELRSNLKGDFVWYREDGKAYLIQDPAVISKVREVWKPVSVIGALMESQSKRMDVHSKVMDGLAAQIDRLTSDMESGPAAAERERLERRMEALAARQEAIAGRMVAASETLSHDQSQEGVRKYRELEAATRSEMVPLQREMAQMQRDMAAKMASMHRNAAPMKALNVQMAEANKPMAELGRRMGELGREQAKASREAERNFKAVIQDAIRDGKAVPAKGLM